MIRANETLQPLGDRVVIELDEADKTSASGNVVIPDTASDVPFTGVALNVGPDVKSVKIGHRVVFGKYSGSRVPFEGGQLLLCREEEIFAIVVMLPHR